MPLISVSLLEFFRTGSFGPITIGMTKPQVLAALGAPHGWGCGPSTDPTPGAATIWVYDYIEFHFDSEGTLYLIWCDYLERLQAHGQTFHLELWIYGHAAELTASRLESALEAAQLTYTVAVRAGNVSYVMASGVTTGREETDATITYLGR